MKPYALNAQSVKDLPPFLQELTKAPEQPIGYGRPRFTLEEFAAKVETAQPGRFSFPFAVFNTHKEPILATCRKHGITWSALPLSLLKGTGCHLCHTEKLAANRAAKLFGHMSYEQLKAAYEMANEGKRLLLGENVKPWHVAKGRNRLTVLDESTGKVSRPVVDDVVKELLGLSKH